MVWEGTSLRVVVVWDQREGEEAREGRGEFWGRQKELPGRGVENRGRVKGK